MKEIKLIFLFLTLPCFALGTKPPEGKCDSFSNTEREVLKNWAQEQIRIEELWSHTGQTQMSEPKLDSQISAVKTPWIVFIKDIHKCPETPWWQIAGLVFVCVILGMVAGMNIKSIR